jgi:hypothetical protein
MKMAYNPEHVLDRVGTTQGFLSGSMLLSSLLIGLFAGNELVSGIMIIFIVLSILLFIAAIMRFGAHIFFNEILISFFLGLVMSFLIFLLLGLGILEIYLIIVIVLTVVVQLRSRIRK